MNNSRIWIKTDEEPCIICAQKAIHEFKPDIIPINSPVGETACIGRVDDVVRRVQEKIRTLRSQVECAEARTDSTSPGRRSPSMG